MSGGTLVTGGAGFIGSHLVDALLAKGERVTVLDDFSIGSRDNLADAERSGRLTIISGSICDRHVVARSLEGCEQVYHLAVQCVRRSLGFPLESHDVNATGTINVLEAARQARVKRFVYCSSSEVYGNTSTGPLSEDYTLCKPVTVYGGAKLAGELYADAYWQTYRLPTVIVRPFNAYGPRAYQTGTRAEVLPRFVNRVLSGLPPVIFGDPKNGRDFTYVTDVAAGIVRAGESGRLVGDRINVAFGQMISVEEVARIVMAMLGRNDLTIEIADARPGDVRQLQANIAKARDVLSFEAKIPFQDGVKRYLEWVLANFTDAAQPIKEDSINWTLPVSEKSS